MIIGKKNIINDLSDKAKDALSNFAPSVVIAADTENVYDVRINLNTAKKTYPPYLIALSYDTDAGYFIDIDDVTWEFQDDEVLFRSEAIRLFEAVRENKVKIIKKKLLSTITLGYEAHIL